MPVIFHEIKSYDEHQNLINSLHGKLVICWYVGARLLSTGMSWCGDCRDAEPVVRDYLNNLKIKNNEDINVIYTELEKDYLRDKDCDFRHDPKVKLEKVPTLLNPKNMKILVEEECKNTTLLDMFFENFRA